MLDLPVVMSMLGVRWHLEHLAISGDEKMLCMLPRPEVDIGVDETEPSLLMSILFCWG
jgi:hypothetical protein